MSGLRDQILAAPDLGGESVEMPEWDCTLWVRGLTAGEVETFGKIATGAAGAGQLMASVAVVVTYDEEGGQRVFDESDVEALSGKSPAAVKRLFDAAQRVSGLDEIEKN